MPRSMADPNYRYTPWTAERRQRASEAGKERWRKKREAERAEWERQWAGPIGRVRRRIAEERDKQEAARREFFRAKQAIEQLEEAQTALLRADAILRGQGIEPL